MLQYRYLLLLLLVRPSFSSLQCFNVSPSHAISNSKSIAELYHVTAGECLNYCILESAKKGDGCVSVVFHKEYNTCQLYGHDGTYDGSQVVYLEDHEFYVRSSWEGPCKDSMVPVKGYKKLPIQAIGFQNYPSRTIATSNIPQFANNEFPIESIPISENARKAPQNFENELIHEIEQQQREEFDAYNYYDTTTQKSTRNSSSAITTTFKNPTHEYKCSKAETLSYFLIHGFRLSTKMLPQRLNGVDQSSCIMYCSQNINAIGENIPCFSLNYESTDEICEMYGKQSRPLNSWAELQSDDDHVVADKFCIKTKNDCPVETIHTVHMHKQMERNIIAHLPGINSKVACLAECIDHKDCQAITYKTGICILHSTSPATNPSLLMSGSQKTMVIENGCFVEKKHENNEKKMSESENENSSEWQEWSLCQYGVKGRKMRVRQRNCSDCDEDLEMEEC